MKLKELLERRRLTQASAARKLGVSQSCVAMICAGQRNLSAALMRRVSAEFRVGVRVIADGYEIFGDRSRRAARPSKRAPAALRAMARRQTDA